MAKVRIEVVPDFGPQKGQVLSGIVVDPEYDSILKAVQNKLKLKKKEAGLVTLSAVDFTGTRILPHGDLSELLRDGVKIVVSKYDPAKAAEAAEAAEASQSNDSEQQASQLKLSKKMRKSVDELQFAPAGRGALSARGRPSLEQLAALKHCKGVTAVVTLLLPDEASGAAAHIGDACARLGLKWCHAPLAGPAAMNMITRGADEKIVITPEDLASFRKISLLKQWLEKGEERLLVHCAAGLHRTGIFLYLLLRVLGDLPEQALENIRQIRQHTFDEFMKCQFQHKTEAILAMIDGSVQRETEAVVELVAEHCETHEAEEVEIEDEQQD